MLLNDYSMFLNCGADEEILTFLCSSGEENL